MRAVPKASRLSLTRRGAGAVVGSLAVVLLAFYSANVLVGLVATFLIAFVLAELLAFAVATRGFGPGAFVAERVESSSFVGVGGAGLVSVRLRSRLAGRFYAELFDAHSDRLALLEGEARLLTWWTPGEELRLAYVVSPTIRGVFDVGPTVVIAHDTLGLAFRAVEVPSAWPIEAIPRRPVGDAGPLARRQSSVVGQTWVATPGSGTDFRALREYTPGDELRHVAWSRSGQGRLYVREFDRESQQDLVVAVDTSRGMAIGVGPQAAIERSAAAATAVLRRSFDEGGRAGAVVFDQEVRSYVGPGRGSAHEFRVFRALAGARVGSEAGAFDVALDFLAAHLERPTSVLACSSGSGDPTRLATAVAGLRQAGHRLYVLVPDVRELLPPLPGGTERAAFDLLSEPATRRTRAVADRLVAAGAEVGLLGRGGEIEAVNRVFRRDRPGALGR